MAQSSNLLVSFVANLTSALDHGTAAFPAKVTAEYTLTNGTGADKAQNVFADQRTLAASATEDLDLAGALTNAFGVTITFTKIKALLVKAAAGNTNDVLVGGASATQFATPFGDATDVVKVKPGGCFVLIAPDANGYAVTAGTADLLKIANSAGTTGVTYDIVIIGE